MTVFVNKYPCLVCIQRFKLFLSELANNYVQIIAEEGERDLNNIFRPDTETTDFSLSIQTLKGFRITINKNVAITCFFSR